MLPGLQPSRPKPPQQPALPTYAHEQRRIVHEASRPASTANPQPPNTTISLSRPRSQVEAMPPFGPAQTPATFFTPLYDSAIRHPVFFTQNLKKPPFPIPQNTSQGWNPVASGYIMEQKRAEATGRTKL
ncbi:Nn.00g116240.m01.CDS01 [Neocucurbitaria sp. VM-36]